MKDDNLLGRRDLVRLRVLQTLLRAPALSRADLSRKLSLSRTTLTALLLELGQAGMVELHPDPANEERRYALGRPPMVVSLSPTAAYAVGLDFEHRHVRAVVCNLAGEIVSDRWTVGSVDDDPHAILNLAEQLTTEALSEAGVSASQVIGIGAGFAVPVDRATGAIHAQGILPQWAGIQPALELEARLGLPVLIENDATAGAIGEHMFGAGRGATDMAYVRLSVGVGLGLILDGKPYRGISGVAGELGHISTGEDGILCRCGNRGCIETVASPSAVTQLLERSRGEPVSITDLLRLVERGDRGARRAVADAGTAIGTIIAAAVNLLNPELVVIGGQLASAGETLLEPIRQEVDRRAGMPASAAVRVVQSQLAERSEVLGAAATQLARAPHILACRFAADERSRGV